jgi:tetratricopeptide (TPR) repeat protein
MLGLGVGGVGAAVAMVALARSPRGPDCAGVDAPLATAWPAPRRAALVHALQERGAGPAAASELAARLDDYASRWRALRRETCAVGAERGLGSALVAARTACLDARATDFTETVKRIEADRDSDALAQWHRISALWPVEACRDSTAATVGDAIHRDLMRALAALDPVERSASELEALRARAEAAGDLPALLEIELVLGTVLVDGGTATQADAVLQHALALAEKLGIATSRLRALAALARSACRQERYDESAPLFVLADADARRDPADGEAMDAVSEARAECLYQRRDPEVVPKLRELIAHATARWGADSPEVLPLHLRLGQAYFALDRPEDGTRELVEFDRIAARYVTASDGAAQREEAAARSAIEQGDLERAIEHQRRATELWTPDRRSERAFALASLATDYEMAAAWRLAAATHAEVAAMVSPDAVPELRALRIESLVARGNASLVFDDIDAASTAYDQASTEARALTRADLAVDADLGRGRVAVERHDFPRGARLLREAIAAYRARANASAYRIGIAQLALAIASWETGDHGVAVLQGQQAELNVGKGIDDARTSPLGRKLVAFRSTQLAKVVAWRDAHR